MRGSVVLLGAGFSVDFGIPAMRRFMQEFFELVPRRYPALQDVLPQLEIDEDDADLEQLLAKLTAAVASAEGLSPVLRTADVEEWARRCQRLRSHLLSFIVERCEQLDVASVRELVGPFVDMLANRGSEVSLYSTNYDRVVELAAEQHGHVLADGFRASGDSMLAAWAGDFEGGLPFFKLHGSVTWYVDPTGPTFMRLDRGYPMPDDGFALSQGGTTLRPLMVLPTTEKDTLHDPYTALSREYVLRLNQARFIVVIGSSLRDEHLVDSLRSASPHAVLLVVGLDLPAACARLGVDDCIALEATGRAFLSEGLEGLEDLFERAGGGASKVELAGLVEAYVRDVSPRIVEAMTLSDSERLALRVLTTGGGDVATLEALQRVRGSRNASVFHAVLAALGSGSEDVRTAACATLSTIPEEAAVEALYSRAVEDSSRTVRIEAALGLKGFAGSDLGGAKMAWDHCIATGPDQALLNGLFVGPDGTSS